MKPFAYTRVTNSQAAIQAVVRDQTAKFIAGGTNLIDLMKEDVDQPDHLVDINRLELTRIEERDGGLRLGALGRNSDTANHRLVRERYPLVSQAILAGASRATAERRDQWRQPDAANALLLLLRSGDAL